MTLHIDAVFENGTFRPSVPVTLENGTQVALTVETQPRLVSPGPLAISLAEIATMPPESVDDGFSGVDHDKILYGSQGAR